MPATDSCIHSYLLYVKVRWAQGIHSERQLLHLNGSSTKAGTWSVLFISVAPWCKIELGTLQSHNKYWWSRLSSIWLAMVAASRMDSPRSRLGDLLGTLEALTMPRAPPHRCAQDLSAGPRLRAFALLWDLCSLTGPRSRSPESPPE
uniref:uncharacterized protein LOC118522634 isoform X3 n=1 Tax=Halichoerus grypus TaxID=9711 RepID=UPI001658D84C|nr:uncharacterized protein LOC118522634 isoform X3 [Halichoerus grypus]